MSWEVKQGFEAIETALLDKQSVALPREGESSMSAAAVWDFVWKNIEDALAELNRQATADIKQNYKALEPALQKRQSLLESKLDLDKMSGYELWSTVWNEVWNDVWDVINVFNRQASAEIKQKGEELQVLLDKQTALQSELHRLLTSWDKPYNLLKGIISGMMKGNSE